MFKQNPLTQTDFYKVDHRKQYPEGTEYVYSNFTPRSTKYSQCHQSKFYDDKIVFFGLQYVIKHYLIDMFNDEFFSKNLDECIAIYKQRIEAALGENAITYEHIDLLHNLGYLPLLIKALPEGSRVKSGVPVLTVINTIPEFFWLTNFIETCLSAELWKLCNNATIAFEYRRIISQYTKDTCDNDGLIPYQAHDFSFRGMSGSMDAAISGMAHLTSFVGSDTIPAADAAQYFYNATNEGLIASVPATEHSVMCIGGKETELETFKRLITEIYPKGVVSIVSDTWDFFSILGEVGEHLKDKIMARDGKVVFRPDSGDPVKVICGDDSYPHNTSEYVGAIEYLWEIYGGTINSKGFKELDSHVGLIYGDSITLERCQEILERLKQKGFAANNIVFGVGSYTYQYSTRDSLGFAMKATWGQINGQAVDIFKAPKGDAVKKSAKGLLRVALNADNEYELRDCETKDGMEHGVLKNIFYNGKFVDSISFAKIRFNINQETKKCLK